LETDGAEVTDNPFIDLWSSDPNIETVASIWRMGKYAVYRAAHNREIDGVIRIGSRFKASRKRVMKQYREFISGTTNS